MYDELLKLKIPIVVTSIAFPDVVALATTHKVSLVDGNGRTEAGRDKTEPVMIASRKKLETIPQSFIEQ